MLVTSRNRSTSRATSLPVPLLERGAAIELFNDRRMQWRDGRQGRDGGGGDLDASKLPLAVELAAARTTWSPRSSSSASTRHRPARRSAARRPDRHHTLAQRSARATASRRRGTCLFQQLSVFAGGSTLDSAAVVTQAGPTRSRPDREEPLRAGDGRVRMLATIREFARSGSGVRGASKVGADARSLARSCARRRRGVDRAGSADTFARSRRNRTTSISSDIGRRIGCRARARAGSAAGWFWFVRGSRMTGRAGSRRRWLLAAGSPATRATYHARRRDRGRAWRLPSR